MEKGKVSDSERKFDPQEVMGPIGICSKDAEGTAEVTVRFSLLEGYGDHGRPMTFWKRQMLDPFSKTARRIFQGCSIGCSASLLMVIIFQSSPVSMLGHYGLGVLTNSCLEKLQRQQSPRPSGALRGTTEGAGEGTH